MILPKGWWIACLAEELKSRPLRVVLHDIPIVFFRNSMGKANAVLDRCAHRNAPLSAGHLEKDVITCPYHGWKFDGQGRCVAIPHALISDNQFQIPAYTVKEEQGYLWITSSSKEARFQFPNLSGHQRIDYHFFVNGTWDQVIENQLDMLHTSVLHDGWFRTKQGSQTITAEVRPKKDSMEVEYFGEKRPSGLFSKILSPTSGELKHIDRLFLPSVTQVEYEIGSFHLLITTFVSKETEYRSRCFTRAFYRLWIPRWVIYPFFMLGIKTILRQDQQLLEKQSETLKTFKRRHFVSTPLDFYQRFIQENILMHQLPTHSPLKNETYQFKI